MRIISKTRSNARHDLLAMKIAGRINRSQCAIVAKMSKWFNMLTPSVQMLLVIIIIIAATISLLSGMIFPDSQQGSLSTTKIATSLSPHHDLSPKSIRKHKN